MRSVGAVLLCAMLLSVAIPHFYLEEQEQAGKQLPVSPRNNAVDYVVTGIEIGNNTLSPEVWVQPDSSTLEYMTKGELIQINVTFLQAGIGQTPILANATLEIWHPIGIVLAQWSFNISIPAGGQERVSYSWEPTTAHSSLSDDGWLSGGVTIRGTVDAGVGIDGDESNNQLDRDAPIALWIDPMENGFCNDEAFEGKYCTNQLLPPGNPSWFAAGYDSSGYVPDTEFPTGTWRMENNSSSTGEWHWTVSGQDTDYASNRFDRLRWAWSRIDQNDACSDSIYGHGLGYGEPDSTISSIHGLNLCLVKLNSPYLYSIQIATDAWGSMEGGDTVMMETDSGTVGSKEYLNYSAFNLSSSEGDWTRLVWNATGLHQTDGFTVSFLLQSDTSVAGDGVHLDSFMVFAIERYPDYTLDPLCTFPDTSTADPYDKLEFDSSDEASNSIVVEAADPHPPTLHCRIFNKGYIDIRLRYYTEVSNSTWMDGYPLRTDSNNQNDHDNNVPSEIIFARTYTDVWFNLTIPDGVDVQDLEWNTWINDFSNNQTRFEIPLPVSVKSTYRMEMERESVSNPAAVIDPGGRANITINMKNIGNQVASWNLGGLFADDLIGNENINWYDLGGSEVEVLQLDPLEEITLLGEMAIPPGTSPGTYGVQFLANPRTPNNFIGSDSFFIEVPVFHDLVLQAPPPFVLTSPANQVTQTVQIFMFNFGNTDETFDLSLISDFRVAELSKDSVSLEKNGGTSTISLILPMPYGLQNFTFPIEIVATSQSDSSYSSSTKYFLDVPVTNLVEVPDKDLSEEVFAAGSDPRTMKWEVWNNGNVPDSFDIELSAPSDVITSVSGISGGSTPLIQPGSSFNLSLIYSFEQGADGAREISLKATSSMNPNSFDEGTAIFDVGTVGFLTVSPPITTSNALNDIVEVGDDYELVFSVRSTHPQLDQQIRTEVELENPFTIYDARVIEEDRNFVLKAGETRNVTVQLDIRQENLDNLFSNSVDFGITLNVISELDTASRPSQITLIKTEPIVVGPDPEEIAWKGANYLVIALGLSIMGGVLLAAFRILRSARSPLEEFSSLEDYNMMVDGWDGSKTDSEELPSADDVANSMYGGSKDLFEQPPAPSQLPSPDLPVPEGGLPDGWTLEQWNHYGQEWIDSNKEE